MRTKGPRTPGGNSVIQSQFSFFGPRVKAGSYTVKLTKGGQTLVELFMAPGDLGRVIGRQGRTAQAIRTLVSATAELEGRKATLEFRDQ